jgi:hypothetical protein
VNVWTVAAIRRVTGKLALVLLTSALLSACTFVTGNPDGLPGVAASAASDCYSVNESVDTPPPTIATLSRVTTAVVIAEVTEIEQGTWNTRDGEQPVGAFRAGPDFNPGVITPVHLRVERWIRGDDGPTAIRAVNPGGIAGCVEHSVSNAPLLVQGRTYAFFLQPSRDADMVRHPELPQIIVAWPVTDGTVETMHDGMLGPEEFEDAVANPVQPPTTSAPTPAGLDNPG